MGFSEKFSVNSLFQQFNYIMYFIGYQKLSYKRRCLNRNRPGNYRFDLWELESSSRIKRFSETMPEGRYGTEAKLDFHSDLFELTVLHVLL